MQIDKALLPLVTPPKFDKSELKALAEQSVDLDLALVRSVVVFVNMAVAAPDRPAPVTRSLAECFAWIPEALRLRATKYALPPQLFDEKFPGFLRELTDTAWLAKLLRPGEQCDLKRELERVIVEQAVETMNMLTAPNQGVIAPRWLNAALKNLVSFTAYRANALGEIRSVSVPAINNVSAAIAYAVALVHGDAHGLKGRVRFCPYGYPKRAHIFLDYREEDGAMVSGRAQRFCCEAHSNRYRVAKATRKPK